MKELCEGGRTALVVIIVEVWRSALRFEELALLCLVRVQRPKVTVRLAVEEAIIHRIAEVSRLQK